MDRVIEAVSEILDFADDRPTAWLVAAGAALATIASWWFALSRPLPGFVAGVAQHAPPSGVDRLLAVVAVFAPFVLLNAAWQAVAPGDAIARASEDHGPLQCSLCE